MSRRMKAPPVALRWDKVRARDLGRLSHYSEIAAQAALQRSARPLVTISKADARKQADQATDRYHGGILRVLKCKCGHVGKVRVPIDCKAKFRCSVCNNLI